MKTFLFLVVSLLLAVATHAEDPATAAARQQAMAQFPDLAKQDTPLHQRFTAELTRLASSNDVLLKHPNWPLILATRCAEDLNVPASFSPALARPPAPPAATPTPTAIKPAPHFAGALDPVGDAKPAPLSGHTSLDPSPSVPKTIIKGQIETIDMTTGMMMIFARRGRVVGVDVADGTIGLKEVPQIGQLSQGDLVDVVGAEDGFYDNHGYGNTRVRVYRFVSGHFLTAGGKLIK